VIGHRTGRDDAGVGNDVEEDALAHIGRIVLRAVERGLSLEHVLQL
jgi:hypothetical protein